MEDFKCISTTWKQMNKYAEKTANKIENKDPENLKKELKERFDVEIKDI